MKKLIAAITLAGVFITGPITGHAALGDQTLKSGMKHNDVKELHQALKNKGYYKGPITTSFGPITKSAVQAFQRSNGLKADGIAGKGTFQKLGAKPATTSVKPKSEVKGVMGYNTSALISTATKYVNVPYKWGGSTPSGFDCSGYLNFVFKQSTGITLPRTVEGIYQKGEKVATPRVGDLVFFETYKKGASHAGIYLGNGKFIHSSSSKGVSVASMSNSYWKKRYLGAKSY